MLDTHETKLTLPPCPLPSPPADSAVRGRHTRGASFGLGAIIKQVSAEAFGGQLGRIVPRLFRYRFDPSAKTRAAMDQLWQAVVGGGGGDGASGGDFSAREKEVRGLCVWVFCRSVCAADCVCGCFAGRCVRPGPAPCGHDGRGGCSGAQTAESRVHGRHTHTHLQGWWWEKKKGRPAPRNSRSVLGALFAK